MKSTIFAITVSFFSLMPLTAYADCVSNAKYKTKFVILDTHTLLLKGGTGGDILIKTFHFIHQGSEITVLKDNFCSYESSVLYIDGQVVNVNDVHKL